MRAPWLVRTSALYFRKARALRHTSALLRYNARNLCHQNERAQTLEKCEKHSPSVRASPHVIGLENSRCALYKSGAKLKPIACWPLVFFHASVCCDISFALIGRYDFDYEHSRDWLRRKGGTWM